MCARTCARPVSRDGQRNARPTQFRSQVQARGYGASHDRSRGGVHAGAGPGDRRATATAPVGSTTPVSGAPPWREPTWRTWRARSAWPGACSIREATGWACSSTSSTVPARSRRRGLRDGVAGEPPRRNPAVARGGEWAPHRRGVPVGTGAWRLVDPAPGPRLVTRAVRPGRVGARRRPQRSRPHAGHHDRLAAGASASRLRRAPGSGRSASGAAPDLLVDFTPAAGDGPLARQRRGDDPRAARHGRLLPVSQQLRPEEPFITVIWTPNLHMAEIPPPPRPVARRSARRGVTG